MQLPEILTRLFYFIVAKRAFSRAPDFNAHLGQLDIDIDQMVTPFRRRSWDLDIFDIMFGNPFECEIIPLAYFCRPNDS